METLQSALAHLRLGPMSTSGNLAVFPLESTNEEDPHFLLLGEAMARYGAKVVERGAERGGATVGRIVFHNKAPLDVLLLDGEELRGGLQNRVVNKSILVPAHTELEIPVSCVERGRWSREAHGGALRRRRARSTENKPPLPPFAFGPTDPGPREPSPTHEQEARRSAPPSWVPGCSCPACLDALERSGVAPLDRMKEQDLSPDTDDLDGFFLGSRLPSDLLRYKASLLSRAFGRHAGPRSTPPGVQSAVWDGIERKMRRMRVRSHTSAMSDIYQQRSSTLAEMAAALRPAACQVGAAFAIDGKLVGVEVIGCRAAYEKIHDKIIHSYAIDAIETYQPNAVPPPPSAEQVTHFLRVLGQAPCHFVPGVGKGLDVSIGNDGLTALGLVDGERLIHLAAFPTH